MKPKIIAKNKEHLGKLIHSEIKENGDNCDLNHIDVSRIKDMKLLFAYSNFRGNIADWDVSNVENMSYMFNSSKFNGDISNWNTSNVKDMNCMFNCSWFNGDISKWHVSKVKDMSNMFRKSDFNGDISMWNVTDLKNISYMFQESKFIRDISDWKPYSLEKLNDPFLYCSAPIPYWAEIDDCNKRKIAIDNYWLNKKLNVELVTNKNNSKKLKI